MEILYLYVPILILAIHIITQHFLQKLHNLPPTPFPIIPFIGHIYLLKKPFHRALSKVSKKYGSVLFLKLGSRPVLLVSSPSLAEECFTKNDIIFANRPDLLSGKHFGYNYTSLPWSSYGDHWRNLRRIASLKLLSSHQIHMLSHFRVDEIQTLIHKFFQLTKDDPDSVVQVKTELFEFMFNVLMRMITGKKYVNNSREAETFKEIVTESFRVLPDANVVDFLPFMRWFGYKDTEKKMISVQKKRDKFMQNVIEEHRRREKDDSFLVDDKTKSIMEVLLDLQKAEPEYYTDETIRNLLLVLYQAGSDTSATTLEWAFSLLLDNPNVLRTAQAQIDNLVGQERLVSESDLSQLPYLYYIINETLRLYPPVPLLLPHQSSAECTVGGYRVPSGTVLLVNVWAIHHDSKVWEEPEKFKPERFRDFETGKNECKFLPFGSGRRACPGENLAMRAVGLALGCLIQCFEWEKVSEIDMNEATGITAPKAQPLVARCSPRPFLGKLLS